jgi:PqqD family protein of HPr-rel-A system
MLRAMSGPIYISDAEGCRSLELEGLTLLFHGRSGMTHILAPPSPQILEVLAQGEADAETLIERLAAKFEFEADGGAEALAARLAELDAAGLVRRI